ERLAEVLGELARHEARHHVHVAARRDGDDETHRARRVRIRARSRPCRDDGQEESEGQRPLCPVLHMGASISTSGPAGKAQVRGRIGNIPERPRIMQLNAMFPTRDIGADPARIRDWAQAAEDLGYAYIEVPDHVFGAAARDGWTPRYDEKDPFHETFVTLGFLAAVTRRIRLSSGILIAPQRQTGLIAKQAAEVDLLSGGRLR